MQNNDRKVNVTKSRKIATTLILLLGVGVIVAALVTNSRKLSLSSRSQPSKTTVGITQEIPQPLPTFEDFGITIEKLRISAPVIPDVDGSNEDIYYPALAKGVAQFKGSSNPDGAGNLFIFGHSSYFAKAVGDYKEVFKELNLLKEGDEFVIHYKKTPYRYKVTKSYETNDKDWSILAPSKDSNEKTITIMTCWPPGTIQNRWVIRATQV